ncbi:metallophosphoesterase [Campylobacter sp. faydin G-24]|uniref:Metallophosphoesterase n=1 Tax=Campylobacter anatolicus TaxID=2829105 RepID=A0ABS5HIB0_9BACT|nr:metallophosphoesterase [Campylobacter anatolicus]MBR8464009.1 metallophosphoesterase [Campylobacter anatolicus]MBR8465803.1 metallophosphoesterase [Campylobacter anatolicus]
MSEQIYIIGDVHGCFKTLLALINKLPNGITSRICFVGDLVDRGMDSAKVVELIIQNKFECVMGNHERRLVLNADGLMQNDLLSDDAYDLAWYFKHGGFETFASYADKSDEYKRSHVEFLSNLPIFIEFDEFKTLDDRHLVISHSAVGKMWYLRNSPNHAQEFKAHVLSGRDDTHENIRIFNVFGHTPLNEPLITHFSANIDLGCGCGRKVMSARLCALEFPSMRIFTQDNIE